MSIQVQNICKRFGDQVVLDNVNLEVKTGELIALLGPSGSGKTTLLRIIAGMDIADSGTVLLDGDEALSKKAGERNVGFVFQHYALFKHMTVFENVAFGLRMRPKQFRLSDFELKRKVMKLLHLVHLDKFHSRYPSQLSGGQRQRVALARALAVEPKLLLLDEPFGALDAKVRKELRRWMRRLHDDINVTSIFVTHDQEEAMEVADRVVVMGNGRIEQAGTPGEVYHHPVNSFVYDFLGNYNVFKGWKDEDGKAHLLEYEAKEKEQFTMPDIKSRSSWMNRYPEITGLLHRILPGVVSTPPALSPPQKAAADVKKLGKPVKLFSRPHEIYVTKTPDEHEYVKVLVTHLNPAGPLVKIEMERLSGEGLTAEVAKDVIDSLAIKKNDYIFIRPKNTRVFDE
ncbi:MAG TPA: sulfate ABC transporter ATP-binding protein [Rickettsiales bacterium]|nr:sulfate ABC transporter ATP-binding protein [Rickettsiales bacterium]